MTCRPNPPACPSTESGPVFARGRNAILRDLLDIRIDAGRKSTAGIAVGLAFRAADSDVDVGRLEVCRPGPGSDHQPGRDERMGIRP